MVKKIKTTTIRSGWGRGRGFVSLPLRPLQRLDPPSWPWPSTRRFTSSRGRRTVPSRRCVFYRCCNHGPRTCLHKPPQQRCFESLHVRCGLPLLHHPRFSPRAVFTTVVHRFRRCLGRAINSVFVRLHLSSRRTR